MSRERERVQKAFMTTEAYFDQYAAEYDTLMQRSLALAGEDKSYFARGRIEFLARHLRAMEFAAKSIMDFGCGTGTAIPLLKEIFQPGALLGVDVSGKSLEIGRKCFGQHGDFQLIADREPAGDIDLTYVSSVFHHILPRERPAAFEHILRSLRPGGIFAFWEHNPWNPGTLHAMSRCPFDDDAITISPFEARSLLSRAGFKVLRTDFLFIFPHALAPLRPIEPFFSRFPIGAQYQVLCRKPV